MLKGMVIVCGKEQIKLKNDESIKLKYYLSEDKVIKPLSDLFDIDISETQ